MTREEFLHEVAKVFFQETGIVISKRDIRDDGYFGLFYYMPENSLESNSPLVLHHRMGIEVIIFPYQDMDKIYDDVENYIKNANWNVGYYWGGGSMLKGIHWEPKPLKEIYDYFKEIRMQEKYSYVRDDRFDLCNGISDLLYEKYGLIAIDYFSIDRKNNICRVYPHPLEEMGVEVYIPTYILTNLMYHPGTVNIEKLLNNMQFEFATNKKDPHPLLDANPREFWKHKAPNKIKRWNI